MESTHIKFVGPASRTLIIFLHEGLGCIDMWKGYPEVLCNSLNVHGLIYDRAGYGMSQGSLINRKADYLHLATEELDDIINEVSSDYDSIILYGHSDGGSISLIYASSHSNVKAVITEAAHVINEQETIDGVAEARPYFDEGKFEGLRKYHGDRYKEVFFAWNDIWLDDSFKDWDITDEIQNISCPLLVVQGLDDQYGTLKQIELIKEKVPSAVSVYTPEKVGHSPHKDVPLQLIEKVESFINGL